MSETKHEIPAAMLDVATAAIKDLRDQVAIGFCPNSDIAKAALEAVGVAEALLKDRGKTNEINLLTKETKIQAARIAELEKQLHNAMTGEGCPHGCVRPSQCLDCIKERG